MKLAPVTYLLLLHGRCIGTAQFIRGHLQSVQLHTSSADEVHTAWAMMPSRESNINSAGSLLRFVDTDNLEIGH